MSKLQFKWQAKVRDYEIDSQGVVGHAKYINYLEQARNDYARSLGIDFVEYYKAGFIFVVAGIDIEYRKPLFPGNDFYILVNTKNYDDKRMSFEQEIKRTSDDVTVSTAIVKIACIDIKTRKSSMPDMLRNLLEKELNN